MFIGNMEFSRYNYKEIRRWCFQHFTLNNVYLLKIFILSSKTISSLISRIYYVVWAKYLNLLFSTKPPICLMRSVLRYRYVMIYEDEFTNYVFSLGGDVFVGPRLNTWGTHIYCGRLAGDLPKATVSVSTNLRLQIFSVLFQPWPRSWNKTQLKWSPSLIANRPTHDFISFR